jgi:MFS transporter, YNFM family, putative membrane transport protein
VSARGRALLPLVLATVATQSSIVVLAPIMVEIGRDLDASLSEVGLARSVLAATAVAVSLAIGPLIDRAGVRPLLLAGALFALAGAGLTAASPSLLPFYAAHLVTGIGVACLLSAGFAGVPAYFGAEHAAWAVGWVVGAQSVAWIVGNPVIGLLAEGGSWRLAYLVPAVIAGLALSAATLAPRGRRSGEAGGARDGLAAVFRDPSARRWSAAELVAYSAWTAELTYAGAFYIESYGVDESEVGFLLSVGSIVFLVVSTNTARLTERVPRKALIVVSALLMGAILVPVLNLTPSVWFTLGLFCAMAMFAALRSTAASALGLAQLPRRPGAMMGARTASSQLGYMIGAAAGGGVLALADFGALGFVLFAGMAISALLIARVHDPLAEPVLRVPEPVPD